MAKFDTQRFRDQNDQLRKKYNDLYKKRQPALDNYEKFANDTTHNFVSQVSPAAAEEYANAHKISDEYAQNISPALQKQLQTAQNYDTPERREQERQKAMVDVGAAADASREASLSRLEGYGIDPSQTRGAALDQNIRLQTALDQVRAGKQSDTTVEEQGRKYVSDATADYGRAQESLAGSTSTLTSGATAALRSGVGAANETSDTNTRNQESQTRVLGATGELINRNEEYKNAEQKFKQDQSGGGVAGFAGAAGSLVGTVGGAYLGTYIGDPALGAQLGGGIGGQLGGAAGGAASGQRQSRGQYQ